jgi:hypothetical protein
MITTHLRNLLTAVICIFAGATAQAQFTGGVEQYPTSDYSQKAVKFSLTEVATQVGTDAATLAEAYNYLSVYYIQNDNVAKAKEYAAKLQGIQPDNETAKQILAL